MEAARGALARALKWLRSMTALRCSISFALAAVLATGCNEPGYLHVSDRVFEGPPTGELRPQVWGCTDESLDVTSHRFAVGAEVEVTAGERLDCVRHEGNYLTRTCVEREAPRGFSVRSTDASVLAETRRGVWRFLREGEVSLILAIGGQDVITRSFTAEPASSLEAVVVEQPALGEAWWGGPTVDASLRSVSSIAVLHGGPGARVAVRARAADGSELCGRLPLEWSSTSGLTMGSDGDYAQGDTRLYDVAALVARGDAASGDLELRAGGAALTLPVEVVEPDDLTRLEAELETDRTGDVVVVTASFTAFAGGTEVYGYSLRDDARETHDCDEVDLRWPDRDRSPRDTRVRATSYCGAGTSPRLQVWVAEAPGVSLRLDVGP